MLETGSYNVIDIRHCLSTQQCHLPLAQANVTHEVCPALEYKY